MAKLAAKINLRTILFINPRFQVRFMVWIGAIATLVMIVMHLSHQWFFFQLRKQALAAGLTPDHVFFKFIEDRQVELNAIAGISFLVMVLLVVGVGLLLSHRIAGPMYRLKAHFEEVAKTGKNSPIHFRDGDYFQEVPAAYNLQFHSNEQERTP